MATSKLTGLIHNRIIISLGFQRGKSFLWVRSSRNFTVNNSNNSARMATLCISVLFTEHNYGEVVHRASVGWNTWPALSQVKVSPPCWRLKYPSPGPTVAPACQLEPPDLSNAARPWVPSLSRARKLMNGLTRTPWIHAGVSNKQCKHWSNIRWNWNLYYLTRKQV